jgi:DNA processing protein
MLDNTIKNFILHASLIKDIGPQTIKILTEGYTDLKTNFYDLHVVDFIEKGISKKKAEILYSKLKNIDLLTNELALLKKYDASFLTPYHKEYPQELKRQESYPVVLYQQKNSGYFDINNIVSLAVVSSRETNAYGKRTIYKLFEELQGQNIVIISGGAIGGDTFIHEAALANNLKTISIIGAGLGHWYPQNNISLFKKIINNGGIIMSHFPLDTKASKSTFPIRNSIIAGISQATLVIQAGLKSGTLITANYALEYGKELGAVPGYIDDIIMLESNNLIKQGAHCITSGNDILEMLNLEKKEQKNIINLYEDCTIQQKKILDICKETVSVEEIQLHIDINENELYNQLFLLMAKKYVMQDIMGNWKTIK